MHGITGVEEMRVVVDMWELRGGMDATGACKHKREEEGRGKGITVYTKILYAVVPLQLGPGLHHTYSMVYFKE